MTVSVPQLRDFIKQSLDEVLIYTQPPAAFPFYSPTPNLKAIESLAQKLENAVCEKIKSLAEVFKKSTLNEEYQRSVKESFADIEHLLRHSPTLLDVLKNHTKKEFSAGKELHHYYQKTYIPLLNMIAKLENDLSSIENKE